MLNRYIEQALKMFDDVDGILIFDKDAVIRYFYTAHPEVSSLKGTDILGQKLTTIYPGLTEENSYVIKCLKTGESYMNYQQEVWSYKGTYVKTINSTVPIREQSKIVGVLDICIYLNKKKNPKAIGSNAALDRFVKAANDTEQYRLHDIITKNPAMLEIKDKIKKTDASDAPVLVFGRTGTGKELVVNAIHQCGKRKNGPLITQNCAAIPSTLLESILFGTVKGSFTGAQDRKGLFEMANGGTLFLDEINSMEIEAQAKLLRVIEEKKIRRLGSNQSKDIDVHIIAAVNEDPMNCIKDKKIREDLYYRLSVIRYDIPELKDRKEDIELLMEYFRLFYNERLNRNIMAYTKDVKEIFFLYDWPGNVRELKNVIEAAFQLNFGAYIDIPHLPKSFTGIQSKPKTELPPLGFRSLEEMINDYEKAIIQKTYKECNFNLTKTAEILKLTKQGLWYKMRKYRLN